MSSSPSAPGPAASSSSPAASDVATSLRPLPASPDIELLRELASKRRPIRDVVDPARGVDVVSEGPRACEPDCPAAPLAKRCSAAELEDVREWFERFVEHDAQQIDAGQEHSVTCEQMTCSKSPRMEWDSGVHMRFERKGKTLRLVSISSLDVLLRDRAEVRADSLQNERTLARLGRQRCPKHARRP